MIKSCDSIEELSQKRELGIDTIIKHLGILKKLDKDLDLKKYFPKANTSKIILDAIKKIKEKNNEEHFSEQGTIRLKPIFDELNAEVSYNDIKIMLL